MTNSSSIQPGEVHIWLSDSENCYQHDLEALYLSWLDPEETLRHGRFKFLQHRREFLVSHALVRACLSRYAAVAPAVWQFEKTAYGRPEIPESAGLPPLRFNLSHTDGLAACAITLASDIGIDVERIKPSIDWVAIAPSCLTPGELAATRALDPEAQRNRFYQLWTLKEAYAKALGLGLNLPFDQFSYQLTTDPEQIHFTPPTDYQGENWQFASLSPTETHCMAVATRYPAPLQLHIGRCIPGLRYDPVSLPMVASSPP